MNGGRPQVSFRSDRKATDGTADRYVFIFKIQGTNGSASLTR